jgi:hypothetical protein
VNKKTGDWFKRVTGRDGSLIGNVIKMLFESVYNLIVVKVSGCRNDYFGGLVVILVKE